ncbi:MAG: hypothetical protein AAFQ54_16355, partial [Pseudomonadota bacterium]
MLAARNIVEATTALDQISLTYDERIERRNQQRTPAAEENHDEQARTNSHDAPQANEDEDGRRNAV